MTVKEYIENVPAERKEVFDRLRQVILDNLPSGFEECINYGMIGYVVPHSTYPAGYHCSPELPLPFINFASQKHFIALYHMGIYGSSELMNWFTSEYPKHAKYKLDIGKSCIRFKKMGDIPYNLIGELVSKMTVSDWIKQYETLYIKK
jgi:hypothetical protein